MDSMKGHVKQSLPGSRLSQWFATAQMVAIAVLAMASLALIVDAATYAPIARMASISAMLLASLGILIETNYRLETSKILRLPKGYAEGRQEALKYLKETYFRFDDFSHHLKIFSHKSLVSP